jgi:hypothetical protein
MKIVFSVLAMAEWMKRDKMRRRRGVRICILLLLPSSSSLGLR